MLGWSLPCGRIFGVEIRLHTLFGLLLLLSLVWTSTLGRHPLRALLLWLILLLAVLVRETARALVALWFGLEPRRLLLLPTGGLTLYGAPEAGPHGGSRRMQQILAVTGPLTNLILGLTVAALVESVAPGADLTSQSWISPLHLVRTLVWVNLFLAAVNLLPAWPLDMGRLLQGEMGKTAPAGAAGGKGFGRLRSPTGMALAIATALIVVGIVSNNMWLIMAGFTVLLGAQVERQGVMIESAADQVRVRDVMLEEYSVLSASATLEDAVEHAQHTLQDVFPVVRGGLIVGAVARLAVMSALEQSGNGYVQGIMTKEFQTAAPEDSLLATLGRVTHELGSSSQLVVVMERAGAGDRVLGLITPQNLQRSMGMLARRPAQGATRDGAE
jgi:predicted transcriptional regulator/Zn-dependent protease